MNAPSAGIIVAEPAVGCFAVEPWLGQQNALNTGDGLIRLSPGKMFRGTATLPVATQ
jgi:galactose mutarotase-like enzyme